MSRKIQFSNYFIIFIILLIAVLRMVNNASRNDTGETSADLQMEFNLNQSLPDSMMTDSLNDLLFCRRLAKANHGTGLYGGFGGFTLISESDSCPRKGFTHPPIKDKFFFVLLGYKIKPTSSFTIANGKYYLQNTEWDASNNVKQEIPVRYVQDATGRGELLIPVSAGKFNIIKGLTYSIVTLLGITAILILIIFPLLILISIARGKASTTRNIWLLRFIGWSLLAIGFLPNLMAILFSLIYSSKIPDGIYLPILETLTNNYGLMIAGLVVLLIAAAFGRGLYAQKELESTF